MEKLDLNWQLFANNIPETMEVICVVSAKKHELGTILLKSKETGLYTFYNENTYTSCDQNEAKEFVKTI